MKRISVFLCFVILMFLNVASASALPSTMQVSSQASDDIIWLEAKQIAIADVKNGKYTWGNWEKVSVKICLNLEDEVFTVYSKETQVYNITSVENDGEWVKDANGGKQFKCYAVNSDGLKCAVRLRKEKNDKLQLYVDFNDMAWVYSVERLDESPATASGDIMWFRTKKYAFARVKNGNYTWDDWESSNMKLSIDTSRDIIKVYSNREQVYNIYKSDNNGNPVKDSKGGKTMTFYAKDQDGDRCTVRLRIDKDGNSQVYFDFNDCAWVYEVIRLGE